MALNGYPSNPLLTGTASSATVTGTAVWTATNGSPFHGTNFNFLAGYEFTGTAGTASCTFRPEIQTSANGVSTWITLVSGPTLTAATAAVTASLDIPAHATKASPYLRPVVTVTNDASAGGPVCYFRFDVTDGPRNMVPA
jgi:hypothetical protein